MIDDRSKGIGCSEIAAVMGLSRWQTPLSVWAVKTGKLKEDDLANFEAAEIGAELEEYVARKFTRKTGIKLRTDSRKFTHKEMPYFYGHIDRLVLDGDSIFEAKTCSAWKMREWEGEEIPGEYVLQVMGYLGLTGRKKGYIACLIGGQKFVWKEINFDPELWRKIEEAVRDFWENFVLKEIPPVAMADDNETLFHLFPTAQETVVHFEGEADERINNLIEERAGGIEAIKLAEEEVSKIEAQLKQSLGEAEAGETSQYRITWKNQSRVSADTKKLKADGLLEQYSIISKFRVLRTAKKGG